LGPKGLINYQKVWVIKTYWGNLGLIGSIIGHLLNFLLLVVLGKEKEGFSNFGEIIGQLPYLALNFGGERFKKEREKASFKRGWV